MKRTLYLLSVSLFLLVAAARAAEFTDSGSVFSVDFPSGWANGKSDDPAMVLKLEKGKSFFEFSKLDSELSEHYLKARVKEQVDSLRGKGNTIGGEIRQAGLHNGDAAFYTAYESMGVQVYMAFFTYNGMSYAISASGLDDGDFREILSTIRKPGEKIEAPKPKKVKTAYRKPRRETREETAQVVTEAPTGLSTAAVQLSTKPSENGTENLEALAGAELMRKAEAPPPAAAAAPKVLRTPYLRRSPLDFRIWAALLGLWLLGAFAAKGVAAKFQNPKLSPPPKDVPPDFFFPFIVSRDSSLKGSTYEVLTRQKQRLHASFNSEHDIYFVGAVYAAILFNIVWSLLAFIGKGEAVTNALLALPGGGLWASVPEILLLAPVIAGISIYLNQKRVLRLYDSNLNLMMEIKKESSGCLLRDGKGKEIARIVKTAGGSGVRVWNFTDTDNQIVFSIKDDYPAAHTLRRLFGSMGGALRSRYGIFASERRAGFVFLDPSSNDRFQVHLDFDFARLAHPAQILAVALYIISAEKDPAYPWP